MGPIDALHRSFTNFQFVKNVISAKHNKAIEQYIELRPNRIFNIIGAHASQLKKKLGYFILPRRKWYLKVNILKRNITNPIEIKDY